MKEGVAVVVGSLTGFVMFALLVQLYLFERIRLTNILVFDISTFGLFSVLVGFIIIIMLGVRGD